MTASTTRQPATAVPRGDRDPRPCGAAPPGPILQQHALCAHYSAAGDRKRGEGATNGTRPKTWRGRFGDKLGTALAFQAQHADNAIAARIGRLSKGFKGLQRNPRACPTCLKCPGTRLRA